MKKPMVEALTQVDMKSLVENSILLVGKESLGLLVVSSKWWVCGNLGVDITSLNVIFFPSLNLGVEAIDVDLETHSHCGILILDNRFVMNKI